MQKIVNENGEWISRGTGRPKVAQQHQQTKMKKKKVFAAEKCCSLAVD
jgi:hypothetical protein